MSALTKIFVVLLVVMSLLLSAGLIVFVNRQENFMAANKKAMQDKILAETHAVASDQAFHAAEHAKEALATDLTNQINKLNDDMSKHDADIAKLNQQLAELGQAKMLVEAQNTALAAAQKSLQDDLTKRLDAYNAQAQALDVAQRRYVEESNRNTELTKKIEIATRENGYFQEELTQLRDEDNRKGELLRKYNISQTGQQLPAGPAINSTPAVNINGVVREFKNSKGVPIATISLGSADAVTRGMKFNVIDPQQNLFLGYFIVDTVNEHDATGRVDGPHIDHIRPNISEVRTQL